MSILLHFVLVVIFISLYVVLLPAWLYAWLDQPKRWNGYLLHHFGTLNSIEQLTWILCWPALVPWLYIERPRGW